MSVSSNKVAVPAGTSVSIDSDGDELQRQQQVQLEEQLPPRSRLSPSNEPEGNPPIPLFIETHLEIDVNDIVATDDGTRNQNKNVPRDAAIDASQAHVGYYGLTYYSNYVNIWVVLPIVICGSILLLAHIMTSRNAETLEN